MEKRSFKKGEIIFREGDAGNEMYVIVSGSVLPYKTVNNNRLELSAISKGNFFGEMGLFSRNTRSATIVAAENSEVFVLTRESLIDKLENDPRFGVKMIEKLIERLEHTHDVIKELEGIKTSFELMYGHKD